VALGPVGKGLIASLGGEVTPERFFLIRYAIDALVADGDMVAGAWTGTLPDGAEMKGLSLYRVTGGLLRSTRHALISGVPV
jgi:hypothetical protein